MRKKTVSTITLTLLLEGMLASALNVELIEASPKTIYVDAKNVGDPLEDGSQEHPFDRIQEGVNMADPGDTVFVYNGTYHEFNIMIDTPLALIGESPDLTSIDGSMVDADIIRVMYADNVVVTGFAIQWGGGALSDIILTHCHNCTIMGNKLTNNRGYGIYLSNSNMNTISDNIIANSQYGIELYQSSNNTISGNNITSSIYSGILLSSSSNNSTIENNRVTDANYGIWIEQSANNSIQGNIVCKTRNHPIWIDHSTKNIIKGNHVDESVNQGILLDYSDENIVVDNIAEYCSYSNINVHASHNNTIEGNIMRNNWLAFIIHQGSSGNQILENIFNGSYNTHDSINNKFYHNSFLGGLEPPLAGLNTWDDSYPSGGNYWSDYFGVDLYSSSFQNETGSDGIGDTPYVIDEDNQDNYPLMKPWGPMETVFNVTWNGESYPVTAISNSSITDFNFSQPLNQISFNVTGPTGTTGFCNLTIPKELGNTFEVLVDGVPVSYTKTENATHYFLYLTYQHSTHTVAITIKSSLTIATIDVDPNTLNLKSRGQWITAYIELPEGYDVSDIDASTIMLNDTIPAELHPAEVGDYDDDGVSDLMVKFDRQEVIALLSIGEATLTITGEVNDTPFEGSNIAKIIGE